MINVMQKEQTEVANKSATCSVLQPLAALHRVETACGQGEVKPQIHTLYLSILMPSLSTFFACMLILIVR